MNLRREHFFALFFGLWLGFSLGNIGFGDRREVIAMFTFADPRLLLTFSGGVGVAFVVFTLTRSRTAMTRRRVHAGAVPGGLLFGAGWALCGACPSIALVQLGEGQWAALLTLVGIAVGVWLYQRVVGPRLRIDTGSCDR